MTGTALRGRPRSAEADRAIADAVVAMLGEAGYAELTMAGVAARAGVSTATLYRRFPSKEALVVSAIEAVIDRTTPPDTGSLEGDLRATLRRIACRMTGRDSGLFLALGGDLARHPSLAVEVRSRLTGPLRDSLREMLDRAVVRGEIPPVADPDVAIDLILGPIHYRQMVTGEPITTRVADRIAALALEALGCRSR